MQHRVRCVLILGLALSSRPLLAQLLETETARLLPAHEWKFASNFELQWSGEGREAALPIAIEYGLSRRLELLVEPVPFTAIHPKTGPRATGLGDLEVTMTYLVHAESSSLPGVAVAGEVKLPTARNALIGTRKTDVAAYLIASRRIRSLDLHANLSYTQPGSPAGLPLRGVFGAALAGVRHLSTRTDAFAEMLASTSASAQENPEGSVAPEVAGSEIVGTLGLAHRVGPGLQVALSVSYDNNGAVLFRPGFVYRTK